jgi:hypothetical protein
LPGAAEKEVAVSTPDVCVIDTATYAHYIERFNSLYPEDIVNAIPDRDAWEWMRSHIPFLDCSDRGIEEIYYFRWWIYRKHIKHTPDGFVVSEFLPVVGHAMKHNTINCPVGHHLYEGRWIKKAAYLDDYCRFMLRGGGDLHQYSCWFADAVYARHLVSPDDAFVAGLLAALQGYYRTWEQKETDGLFHYTPWMDGMEFSISGNLEERFRPTLNSYMYGDALAIARIASIAGDAAAAEQYKARASSIKANVQARLWSDDLEFFATLDEQGNFTPAGAPVREAVGYVPWYFNLPDPGYEAGWRQLNDPQGFCSPVGLTAAEIRHPQFLKVNPERLASWDGAIWPYATSQTLTAMQNLLRNYDQPFVTASDYMRELGKYAASHIRDGMPSISEVLRDPFVRQMSGSEHYNHSTFCDLVITGAAGIVPRPDDTLEISPLFPQAWDYFCLDGARYRGHLVTVAWDRTGERYGQKGFRVYVDQKQRHMSDSPGRVELQLSR